METRHVIVAVYNPDRRLNDEIEKLSTQTCKNSDLEAWSITIWKKTVYVKLHKICSRKEKQSFFGDKDTSSQLGNILVKYLVQ